MPLRFCTFSLSPSQLFSVLRAFLQHKGDDDDRQFVTAKYQYHFYCLLIIISLSHNEDLCLIIHEKLVNAWPTLIFFIKSLHVLG